MGLSMNGLAFRGIDYEIVLDALGAGDSGERLDEDDFDETTMIEVSEGWHVIRYPLDGNLADDLADKSELLRSWGPDFEWIDFRLNETSNSSIARYCRGEDEVWRAVKFDDDLDIHFAQSPTIPPEYQKLIDERQAQYKEQQFDWKFSIPLDFCKHLCAYSYGFHSPSQGRQFMVLDYGSVWFEIPEAKQD